VDLEGKVTRKNLPDMQAAAPKFEIVKTGRKTVLRYEKWDLRSILWAKMVYETDLIKIFSWMEETFRKELSSIDARPLAG